MHPTQVVWPSRTLKNLWGQVDVGACRSGALLLPTAQFRKVLWSLFECLMAAIAALRLGLTSWLGFRTLGVHNKIPSNVEGCLAVIHDGLLIALWYLYPV